MIDHITLRVRDLVQSKRFYDQVLKPLKMTVNFGSVEDGFWGFGDGKDPEFEISEGRFFISETEEGSCFVPVHVAFRAKNQATVRAFYEAALASGGTDNGAPGLRPDYGETYFAAFVLDPDGNNIEAVTFDA